VQRGGDRQPAPRACVAMCACVSVCMCVRICAKLDIAAGAGVVQAVVDNPMLPAVGGSATGQGSPSIEPGNQRGAPSHAVPLPPPRELPPSFTAVPQLVRQLLFVCVPRESPGAVSIVACGPVALVGQARQLACARGYDFRSEDFHF
jgi:hypothetical protein